MITGECTCGAGRPLGEPHYADCPAGQPVATVTTLRAPVTGRPVAVPADIVSVTERCYAAYERKLEGASWETIAREFGWPNGNAAAAEVKRYLDEGRQAMAVWKRTEVAAVWRDRLEGLWAAVQPEASKGKVPSVMAALNIAKTAMALERLDEPSEDDVNVPTVVVPSEDYIAALQAADTQTA